DAIRDGGGCLAGRLGVGRGGRRTAGAGARGRGADAVRARRARRRLGGRPDACGGGGRRGGPARTGRGGARRAQLRRCTGRTGRRADRRPPVPGGVRRRERAGPRGVVPVRLAQRGGPPVDRRARGRLAAAARGRVRGAGPDGRPDRPHPRPGDPAPRRHAHRTGRPRRLARRPPGHLRQVPAGRGGPAARRGRAPGRRALGAGPHGHRALADVLPPPRTGPDPARVGRARLTGGYGRARASDARPTDEERRDGRMAGHWADFQYEIYLNGMTGAVPRLPTDLTRLEQLTEQRLGPGPVGYVAGSAGDGSTARANRAALDRHRIVPRMLRDVHERDLSVRVLGRELPAPLALTPVGVLSIMHPGAEPAAARAAAARGVPFVLSSASSTPMEEVAEAMGGAERWFQLYWPKDVEVARSFLARARAAGYTALVVTLDTPRLSGRPRALDQAYLPFLHGVGTANYFTDPAFRAGLAKPVHEDPNAAVMHFVGMFSDPAKTWPDLAFLRENWDGPIVLKGILHPDDARLAADAGMDGVVVSNHGGRQVAGSVAAADALPRVAEAVGDRLDVLFDSGVRTGDDVFKALALGGRAGGRRGGRRGPRRRVLAGRPGHVAGAVGAGRAGHGGARRPRDGPRRTRPPARPTAGRPAGVRPGPRRAGRAAPGGAGADTGRSGSPPLRPVGSHHGFGQPGVPGGRRDGPAARQQVLVLPHRFGRPALVHGPVAHLDDEVGVRVSGGGSEGQLFVPAGLQLALRGEVVAHVVGPAVV